MRPTTVVRAGSHELAFGERTLVMGVVNVTPDSFSGDGLAADMEAAVRRGVDLVAQGADILDVGGESTRPNSAEVAAGVEIGRVVPVLRALRDRVDVPLSVDTRKAEVAAAAFDAGAVILNDVWGLRRDPAMAATVAAREDVALVAMHNQQGVEYGDLMGDVAAALRESLAIAARAGIAAERVILDPGFGFAKTPAQNLELMQRLDELLELQRPLLVGPSRKSTIGFLTDGAPPDDRLEGSLALAVLVVARGASAVRVHDVAPTVRALRVADAVLREIPAHIRELPAPGRTG